MAQLNQRGIATALICSEPFMALGKNQARVLGVPDLTLIPIVHPLGGLSLRQVEDRAAQVSAPLLGWLESVCR
jgi:hypothetical protein